MSYSMCITILDSEARDFIDPRLLGSEFLELVLLLKQQYLQLLVNIIRWRSSGCCRWERWQAHAVEPWMFCKAWSSIAWNACIVTSKLASSDIIHRRLANVCFYLFCIILCNIVLNRFQDFYVIPSFPFRQGMSILREGWRSVRGWVHHRARTYYLRCKWRRSSDRKCG